MSFNWTDGQFVGGALCLDFANTVIYQTDPARRYDRLQTERDLVAWARHAGVVGSLETDADPQGRLARARALRTDIDGVFRTVATDDQIPTAHVRGLLSHYRDVSAPASHLATPAGLAVAPGAPLLALIAHSAVALAFSSRLIRVKDCAGCGWLYVDRSKSARRRWCDMRTCGNRAKARRHYERTRAYR